MCLVPRKHPRCGLCTRERTLAATFRFCGEDFDDFSAAYAAHPAQAEALTEAEKRSDEFLAAPLRMRGGSAGAALQNTKPIGRGFNGF